VSFYHEVIETVYFLQEVLEICCVEVSKNNVVYFTRVDIDYYFVLVEG
jgi:hypothetical protein